ncbi:Tenascin [Durusdinium trenchii]|uniref:Tenascin n=1 Tax=Durusdinium trenchii TaxID=1381693 RepID=A0ABP0QJS0_9DINO
MKRSPGKAADKLPDGWGAERFVVKEGGEGRVGFYSPGRKQYWMMHHADMRRIGHMGSWEKFRLVDAGAGNVALHNEKHNRFAIPNLDLGTIIALHCGQNNRFVQMIHNRMQGHSDKLDDFNPGWYSVPLKVVDGGNGQLAFYNERAKKYVSMTGTDCREFYQLPLHCRRSSRGRWLPNPDPAGFLAMRSSGNMERSGVKDGRDGDDIPSSGWEEAVFTVLKAPTIRFLPGWTSFNCKTGSGELCKSCPVPSQREAYDCDNKKCATCVDQAQRKAPAHNHCSTCHGGSVIVGRECKSEHVVKSGWSATRDDRRATAECPAGMWLKKCEIERTQNAPFHAFDPAVPTAISAEWDWGDGAFVDEDAKKCTVQTGAAKQKLKAKEGAVFGIVGDKKQAVFSPSGGTCQRSSKSKKQVNAICEAIAPCSTGSGSKCRSCKDIRDRKAYACNSPCATCVAQNFRKARNLRTGWGAGSHASVNFNTFGQQDTPPTADRLAQKDNQCASCDSGHTLAYACNTGGGSKCKSCVEVSKRQVVALLFTASWIPARRVDRCPPVVDSCAPVAQRDDQCATCNSGYFLEDGECKPYNCNTDVCKSCAKQSEQKARRVTGPSLGMWLKNCEILRNQNWDWGDGVFVDDDATSCTVQTGAARKKLRAKEPKHGTGSDGCTMLHVSDVFALAPWPMERPLQIAIEPQQASCSTTRTYGLKSEGGMKKGNPALANGMEETAFRDPPDDPVHPRKSNGKKQVNAICEVQDLHELPLPNSTLADERFTGPHPVIERKLLAEGAENHCASCNPGYYLDGTVCKAYKCGSSCKTCVAQEQRVARGPSGGVVDEDGFSDDIEVPSRDFIPFEPQSGCSDIRNSTFGLAQVEMVQFESTKGKKCKNTPFTCTQKCLDSEQAKNCPQKPCAALAFYKSSGWCHLYEKCDGFESDKHATALLPQETDFCATCNGGFFLEDGICKAYGCIKGTGDKCKTCVVQGKRKEDSHCAACNDGFYLHSRDCEAVLDLAFTCKEGKNRLCESCRPQDERKMDGHCSSCNFGYVLKGDVCQASSERGMGRGFRNRYVKMTSNDLTLSPKKGDEFPAGWSAEKFLVIDAGKGRVALKNTRQNKVISIQSTGDLVPADLPVPQCVDGKFGLNFCSQWCNHEGFWGCGISKLIGKDGRNTDNQDWLSRDLKSTETLKDYTCDCSGCSGCAEKLGHHKFCDTSSKTSFKTGEPKQLGASVVGLPSQPTGKNGEVAFHSPSGSAWMMMTEDNMWGKTSYTAEQIMGSWTRYKVVQPHPLLADGSIIALHCGKHKKFLRDSETFLQEMLDDLGLLSATLPQKPFGFCRMGNSDMSSTKVKAVPCDRRGKNNFPDSWLSAKFRVVDAGFGQIALHRYSDKHQRFIRLHGKDLHFNLIVPRKRSSKQADKKLPGDWADERFTVVYADGKLAFHNPTFNRFLRMNKNGADTSSVRNAEDLPDGWSWERFELVNAKFTCATGDGSSCKTCKNPNDRTVDDHCASCNDGWKLVGTSCEAVPCPADSTGSSVGSGCSCNAGFSGTIEPTGDSPFFKGSCSAVACPSWTDGKNVPSGCACWKGYFGSLQATSSQPYYTGSCKSALVGGTFALHNDANNRFAKMVSNDMSRSPKKKAESLPDGWSSERFQVVEGDAGRVGLKSIKYNKYVCMDHSNMKNVGHLKNWEKFRVWDAGDGSVAFHNSNHNRFIRLGDRALDTSGKKNVRDLPSGWSWERFEVVQAVPGLPTGSTIALNCHKRFLQMSGQQQLDGRSAAVDQLADDWESVRFEVVDAGHGQIALFNTNLKSFVEMTGKDVLRSEETSKTGVSDEARFTVVDMGSGKIALHNAKYNRFVGMRASGEVVRSQEKDGDELPSTWTDAIFKVVQAYKCQTGSGQMCKSCVAPGKREAENHCDSCYAGYALVGRTCKDEHVVTSEKSAKADDKRAAAQCPEGMWLKKCEMKKGGNDWGDGAFVDDASTTCTVQTGTTRQPVIAKATCSTTKTYGMKSQTGWARGNLKVPCPKAIACTCYSAWTVNGECGNVAVFNPENGICSGSGGKRQLNAICEIVSCSTGLGDKCKTCKDVRDRQAEDHCDSCNPGYYISGTSCKAYSCEKGSGSACKTCVAQAKRTADDQCASCNPGWALVGTVCKKEHKVTSSWSKRGDDKRTSVDCPAGMWVKKCWGGFDGDGNWVSNNGKTCNSQATGGMRVKAHADCWTTETLPEVSGRHWKKGRITVDCKVGDAIGCTCYSAWRVKNKCFAANGKNSEASFAPVDHKCLCPLLAGTSSAARDFGAAQSVS